MRETLSKAAFGNAPDNRFGNEPVGNVEAPGLQTYNLSVSKTFQFAERFRLRYQAISSTPSTSSISQA